MKDQDLSIHYHDPSIINKQQSDKIFQNQKIYHQQFTQTDSDFLKFFQGCRKQLTQWVGFDISSQLLFQKCNVQLQRDNFFNLYAQLTQNGLSVNQTHFQIFRKILKEKPNFKSTFKCLIEMKNTQNQFFNEQKKFKYFAKFIREQPSQGKFLFVQQKDMLKQKGKKLCNYFKAFFQYYYLNVLRPSQTTSTTFLRALTVRSSIFDNEDIAYCVSLQTLGSLTDSLQNLDINNIYLKIPQVFNSIRYMKLKNSCRDKKHIQMIINIQNKLKNIDMFKIMYNDYQPFVQVAAEKFGTTQIKLLARKFSMIFQNIQHYQKMSKDQIL